MIEYIKANFDLSEVMSFSYNLQSSQLVVHGKDGLGRLAVRTVNLSRLDAARLFRLHVQNLPGI